MTSITREIDGRTTGKGGETYGGNNRDWEDGEHANGLGGGEE